MQLVVILAERLGTLCDEVRRMDVQAYIHIKKKEKEEKHKRKMRGEKKKKALRGEIEAGNKLESMYKWKKKRKLKARLLKQIKIREKIHSLFIYILLLLFSRSYGRTKKISTTADIL